jgi:hypothetical protein
MGHQENEIGIEEITSTYLYGTLTRPSNLVDEALIRPPLVYTQNGEPVAVKKITIDSVSFMQNGAGRFAIGARIGIVQDFMGGDLFTNPGEYRVGDYFNQQKGNDGQRFYAIQQSNYIDTIDDHLERTYIFQSSSFALSQDAILVIKPDGTRYIKNFALLPGNDNFDFVSGDLLTNLLNPILEADIDPSKIGRTIAIEFDNKENVIRTVYTQESYQMDIAKYESTFHPIDGTLKLASEREQLVNKLWESGITRFIDPQGRAIYYGTNGNDPIIASNIGSKLTDYRLANQVGTVQIAGKGNDTLRGNNYGLVLLANKSDYLLGGDGNDTYFAGNKDIILDSDGSGAVYLGGEHLDGGEKKVIKHIGVTTTNYTKTFIYCECKTVTKWSDVSTDEWEEKEEYYIDKATGTKYILSNSTLSVISSSGTITINNFSNGQLGIHLSEKETIDKKNVERDVFLQEDFCSPLILDINNGTSSTGLGNSQTYFDMDGDGFKERTAWVEQGDGLLVLDRNGNGVIDNGTELFGNFTPLVRGNSASDGFEALLQYDENRDGIIDHNDAPYNQLKVWMDDNANGITDTGELKTLQEAKVASLKLNAYYKSQRKAA